MCSLHLNLKDRGFTLIELLVVVAIIGVLVTLVLPGYDYLTKKARFVSCKVEIRVLERDIISYTVDKGDLPETLADMNREWETDPWGNVFEYMKISSHLGDERTGAFSVSINTDYDLYSKGPDGASNQSVTHSDSRDDVVRGADGYIVDVVSNEY
ncbi:MAG: prepilin-type N-terminal cleavage/methylation domain-containing protein [Desulfuromonadales bacterium]